METQSNTHRLCQSSLFVITATVTVIIILIVIITATDSFIFDRDKASATRLTLNAIYRAIITKLGLRDSKAPAKLTKWRK